MMKKLPPITEFKKIAILQTAFLGDVVLTLPLAQAIKNRTKEAEISFVTTPAGSSIAKCAKAIDKVIPYDKRGSQKGLKGIREIAGILRQENTDLILAPHRSLRTTMIKDLSKVDISVGFDRNALSILYKKRVRYNPAIHEVERNLSLLSAFGDWDAESKAPDVDISIEQKDIDRVDDLINETMHDNIEKFVLMAPGSVWATKRWKEDYFAELASFLIKDGITTGLIGSTEDNILCDGISRKSGAINFAGLTSIPQTLSLISRAGVLVTNDSAPTHFAGLMYTPTIVIFGATSPIFGFGPRGSGDKVLSLDQLQCKPCAIHGGTKCPIGTHECMTGIKPAMVLQEIKSILGR